MHLGLAMADKGALIVIPDNLSRALKQSARQASMSSAISWNAAIETQTVPPRASK